MDKTAMLKNYYQIIKESKCITKREAQMYLSNLESLSMEIPGYEDLVTQARQMVKEMPDKKE